MTEVERCIGALDNCGLLILKRPMGRWEKETTNLLVWYFVLGNKELGRCAMHSRLRICVCWQREIWGKKSFDDGSETGKPVRRPNI